MRENQGRRAGPRLEHLKTVAKKSGVKLTHQRLEIFRELAASQDHPDAETIFRAVQYRLPTMSLDTVYRTLWLLHRLGLVTTLGPQRDGVRFDANLEPHHHYVCARCGLVRDFQSAELTPLPIPEAVKRLGRITGAHVEVRGVCAQCLKQPKTGARSGARTRHPPQPRSTK